MVNLHAVDLSNSTHFRRETTMSIPASPSIQADSVSVTNVIDPGRSAVARFLWLIWAALLAGGLIADNMGNPSVSSFGRLASSVVLILAGWVWYSACRGTGAGKYALLIAIGMTLGALGDFFMSGLLQQWIVLPKPELGGMAAFGLGHVVYMMGFFEARRRAQLNSNFAMWVSILLWQLVNLAGWYFVVFLSTKESTRLLVWPALPYSQLLAGTAGVATGLAVQNRRFTLVAVGAALFLISDLVLAWGMFRGSFPHRTEAVWIPYGGGQMMIVYGIVTAGLVLVAAGTSDSPHTTSPHTTADE